MEAGIDCPFGYNDAIAHVAQTRNLEAGTILALGTVSNEDDTTGCGCIGEYRALELINTGTATLEFMKSGDTVRIELLDYDGNPVMGAIDQSVV